MITTILRCIELNDPSQAPLTFLWDEWDVQSYFTDVEQPEAVALIARMQQLPPRFSLAATVATAEWVVQRFAAVSQDPIPGLWLEAAWACVEDWRYAEVYDIPSADRRGIIKGPLHVICLIVRDAVIATEEGDVFDLPVFARNLAQHLLGGAWAFDTWLEAVLLRLEALNAAVRGVPSDVFGDTFEGAHVSRQLFDTELSFDPLTVEKQVDSFLRGLVPSANPFLREADEMISLGFQGTPYRILP